MHALNYAASEQEPRQANIMVARTSPGKLCWGQDISRSFLDLPIGATCGLTYMEDTSRSLALKCRHVNQV